MTEAIVELAAALDKVCSTDPSELGRSRTIVALQRCLARLEAATARAAAAFETSGEWALDGAKGAAPWLMTRCRQADTTVRRRLRLGRALRHLPATEAAWLEGEIDATHVAALAAARTPATEEALARDERMLVGQARELRTHISPGCWRTGANTPIPTAARTTRRPCGPGGVSICRRAFPAPGWATWSSIPSPGRWCPTSLSRIEAELFEADWADARERQGDVAGPDDLSRSPAQRRADALVEMAQRAGSAPADARRPAPLLSVFVGYETLHGRICELADGTVVTPGSLLPWLDQALVERVVFDPKSRVVDLGAKQRLFTGATLRVIEIRDRECTDPYCEVPGHKCEVDHIEPYSTGGHTVVANGRLACGFHNRARHRRRRE